MSYAERYNTTSAVGKPMKCRTANRLPVDNDVCGWYEIADLTPRAKQIPKANSHFDYAIIGAGFAGLACAHRLAELQPDVSIAVFDAQGVGQGSAGRNSGFMVDLPHNLASDNYSSAFETDRLQIQFNRYGIDFAKVLAQRFCLPQTIFDACGKYHGATTAKAGQHLHEFAASLDKLGEDFTLLNQLQMQSVTGSDYYLSGLYAPNSVLIQPAAFVNALADNLPDNVVLFEHCPVTAIETASHHVGLSTLSGNVSANNVLMTNNGHLGSFGYFPNRLMHIFLTASITRELSETEQQTLGGQSHWGLIPAEPMGSTIRRIGNRIVVRNQVRYSPKLQQNPTAVQSHQRYHQRSFNRRFPQLAGTEMQYTWGGYLCLSKNDVHIFGQVDKNTFAATCQNGLGVAKGTASGALLAEYVTGEENAMHRYLLDMPVPSKLPLEPLMSIGARTVLWAKQLLAGSDL